MSETTDFAYSRSVRVAITHPYSWPEVRRGAERITVETARALAGRGHDVTLFTAGARRGRSSDAGVTTVRYRRRFGASGRHERWFGWRVLPDLVRGRFDVVHSLMPGDALAAIRARRITGHRVVYEEMGNPYRRWWAGLPDRRVRERVVRGGDVYACMSEYSRSVLEAEWGREGSIIPGGVRLDQFAPAPAREPRPTILFSGAVTERRKHLDTLLEAIAILAEREPDVRLWISGPGDPSPLLAAAPSAAVERAVVLDLGRAEEQGERYGRAWVTALPSEADSFGLVMIESLASGTPVVVADDGAPREVVEPGIGAISRLRDPVSLADALANTLALARDPATASRCRTRSAAFDWDTGIAPLLERLYSGTGDDEDVMRRQSSSVR
jgi:glycosyltransferase involved in cell wall biosynthesis